MGVLSTRRMGDRASYAPLLLLISLLFVVALLAVPQTAKAATSVTLSSNAQTETTTTLRWTQSSDWLFSSYTLYYSTTGSNGPWQNIWSTTDKSVTSMYVHGLGPTSNYWFYILDSDSLGTAKSNTLEITTTNSPLLWVTSTTTTTASLSWSDYNSYSSLVPFDGYTIQLGSSSAGPWSTLATITNPAQTTYVVTGLSPGQTCWVIMYDTVGPSGYQQDSYSNSVFVTIRTSPLSATVSGYPATIDVGQSVQFTSSVAGGLAPFSYQWYSNEYSVVGATSSTFTFSPATTGTYSIYLTVHDSVGGSAISNSVSIEADRIPTSLTLTAPTATNIGSSIGISAKLTDHSGNPLPGQTVGFSVGGSSIGSVVTDSSGTASLTYHVNLAAGSYSIVATYSGTSTYVDSSATGPLIVEPFYLTITTTVPNAQVVSVNGVVYATDASGKARIPINEQGTYDASLVSPYVTGTGTRVVFLKWSDDSTSNPRVVVMDSDQAFSAVTKTQYKLTVQGPTGSSTNGAGWYDASTNSNATIGFVWSTTGTSRYSLSSYALDGGSGVDVTRGELSNYSCPMRMDSPHTIVFSGVKQFLVKVTSVYGTVAGAGWYDANSTANFSVSPSSVSAGFLSYYVFAGWSGDSSAKTSSASILVDSPVTLTANWTVDSSQLYIAVVGVVVLAAVVSVVFWTRSRKHARPPASPSGA